MKDWTKGDLFFGLLQALCLGCGFLQVLIDPRPDNLNCVALVVASSTLVIQYLWRSGCAADYPISSLAILGLCVTTQYAALVAQTLGWISFIELLRWPLTTFGVLAVVQVVAVFAHWVYKGLAVTNAMTDVIARHLLAPVGTLSVPPVNAIWAMSILGVIALAKGGAATGDVGGKAFQALNFLAYMPFLIPIYHRQHGAAYCDMKRHGPVLMAYVGLLVVVAVALNARQFMAIGPVQTCLIFLVYFLKDPTPITRKTIAKLALIAGTLSVAVALFADVSIAMVINRDKRDTLGARELIMATIQTLGDREKIEQYKRGAYDFADYKRYDETYLSNAMMARFSETKFHDNNIYFSTLMSDFERQDLWNFTIDKALSILPQPMLDSLDIKIDKNGVFYSFGDFYRYLNEGPDTLGGFAVGSLWAHLIALFGLSLFPVVVFLIIFPTYVFLDAFSRRGPRLDVAPVVMCSTWVIFSYALGGESLAWKFGFYVRDFPQKVILYLLLYGAYRQCVIFFAPPSPLKTP